MTKSKASKRAESVKLPSIRKDWEKEVERFDAHSESKELEFRKCKHKKAKVAGNELRCPCGAAWAGPRLNELEEALTS